MRDKRLDRIINSANLWTWLRLTQQIWLCYAGVLKYCYIYKRGVQIHTTIHDITLCWALLGVGTCQIGTFLDFIKVDFFCGKKLYHAILEYLFYEGVIDWKRMDPIHGGGERAILATLLRYCLALLNQYSFETFWLYQKTKFWQNLNSKSWKFEE